MEAVSWTARLFLLALAAVMVLAITGGLDKLLALVPR